LVFFIIGTQYSLFCIEYFNFLCDMGKAKGWLFGDVIREYAKADFRVDEADHVVETIIGDSQSFRKVRDEKQDYHLRSMRK
jgi:hypothetical protein